MATKATKGPKVSKTSNPFGKPAADESDDAFSIEMPDEGGGVTIPDGPYEGRVTGFEKSKSKTSGNPMWVVDFVITKGQYAGQDFRLFLALTPAAAWKVAETLKALGFTQKVGQQVKFTKADVMGRQVILNIEVDTYEGKTRSVIKSVEMHPKGALKAKGALSIVEDDEDEDEEDVKPAKKSSKKPPVEDDDEDEDEEDLDEDDLDEDDDEDEDEDLDEDEDEDEDEDLDEDEDEDEDLDEDEDEDEDEEEEEPAPVKKTAAKKAAPPAKKTAPAKAAAPAKKAAVPAKKKR